MKNYLHKVLITGGQGQVATALKQHQLASEWQIITCARDEMEITHNASIDNTILKYHPDIIINTAAYTAVDQAEKDQDQCMQVNFNAAKQLAATCKKHHIPLIHLSTDYIFDGLKTSSYHETDSANPINFYGKSKWLGEQARREETDQHIILRVSGVFSEYGNNFFKTMLRLAKEKKELRIVADQVTCPTYAGDIAEAIFTLLKQKLHWGVYHYCGTPVTSWHQFANAIIDVAKQFHALQAEHIKPIPTTDYPTAAQRPLNSVLDCSQIKNAYGITQSNWMHAVENLCEIRQWC